MSREFRVAVTNVAVLAATAVCVMGIYRMGGGLFCIVGLGPMLGFGWLVTK